MKRIGEDVLRELARFGTPGSLLAVLEAWPATVGETVARNAWPARLARDGTLHVATSSSTWAFELGHLAPSILERLSAALGEDTPATLRFAPGPLPGPRLQPRDLVPRRVIEAGPAERAEARRLAAQIEGEELRERVARAVAASLARRSSDRDL